MKKTKKVLKSSVKLFVRLVRKVVGLISVLFGLFLAFWLIAIPIGNEVILNGYRKELQSYDTGSDYEVLEASGACGKLFGNGNGMEYLAVMLIKSETLLTESELSIGDGVFIVQADHEDRLKFILSSYSIGRLKDVKDKLNELEDLEGYYILYSIHSANWGSVWTWDLRAH